MLEASFADADDYRFTIEDRAVITSEAASADALARQQPPLADRLELLVNPSTSVLDETGDNAYTVTNIGRGSDPDRSARVSACGRSEDRRRSSDRL